MKIQASVPLLTCLNHARAQLLHRSLPERKLEIIQELRNFIQFLGDIKVQNGDSQNKKEKLFAGVITEPEKAKKEDTGEIDANVFLAAIDKIEKIRPSNAKTGAEWKFTMKVNGKTAVFQLPNSSIMNSHGGFEDLFKSHFGMYLPHNLTRVAEPGETRPWKKFMIYVELICEEVDPVESIEWIECDIVLEKIAGFKVITDGNVWLNKSKSKNTLLKKTIGTITYYLLKPEDIQQLVKELKISSSVETLGSVMNSRKLKRTGNPACRVGKIVNPAWWFSEESMVERGLKDDPLQNLSGAGTPLHVEGGY